MGGGGLDPGFFPDLGFFSTSLVNRGSLTPGGRGGVGWEGNIVPGLQRFYGSCSDSGAKPPIRTPLRVFPGKDRNWGLTQAT